MSISGNMVGMYSSIGKTLIFVDESGNELTGVITDKVQVFTAGDNDVREGMVYASNDGISTGTKEIPAYYTYEGVVAIPVGKEFKIANATDFDYTKLQVLICAYNSSMNNSVSTEKVSINNKVYNVGSVDVLSEVTTDASSKTIHLGITNNGSYPCVMRYFYYKEEP